MAAPVKKKKKVIKPGSRKAVVKKTKVVTHKTAKTIDALRKLDLPAGVDVEIK